MMPAEHEPTHSRIDDRLSLEDRLHAECHSTGSISNYVNALGIYYSAVDEHKPNLLQMQRLARMAIDMRGQETDSSLQTDSFYWGEILGYTVGERLIGQEWPRLSWEILKSEQHAILNTYHTNSDDIPSPEQLSAYIIGDLETLERLPPKLNDIIETWACQLTDDPQLQHNIIMGYRFIMKNIVQTATNDVSVTNEYHSILEANDIELFDGSHVESIDGVRRSVMEWFAQHYIDLAIKGNEEGNAFFAKLDQITRLINIEMKAFPGLNIDDPVRIEGEVLVVTLENDAETLSEVRLIHDNVAVEGDVGFIYVFEGPTEEMIPRLAAKSRGEATSLDEPGLTNNYTVHLELKNAVAIAKDGTTETFPDDHTVYIVLSNNQIKMSRYVL